MGCAPVTSSSKSGQTPTRHCENLAYCPTPARRAAPHQPRGNIRPATSRHPHVSQRSPGPPPPQHRPPQHPDRHQPALRIRHTVSRQGLPAQHGRPCPMPRRAASYPCARRQHNCPARDPPHRVPPESQARHRQHQHQHQHQHSLTALWPTPTRLQHPHGRRPDGRPDPVPGPKSAQLLPLRVQFPHPQPRDTQSAHGCHDLRPPDIQGPLRLAPAPASHHISSASNSAAEESPCAEDALQRSESAAGDQISAGHALASRNGPLSKPVSVDGRSRRRWQVSRWQAGVGDPAARRWRPLRGVSALGLC